MIRKLGRTGEEHREKSLPLIGISAITIWFEFVDSCLPLKIEPGCSGGGTF